MVPCSASGQACSIWRSSGCDPLNDRPAGHTTPPDRSSEAPVEETGESPLRSATRLVRTAASAWLRTAEWTVEASARLLGVGGQDRAAGASSPSSEPTSSSLRERGAELLRRSADVRYEEEAHPAYARILEQLAPDEGRILRLLAIGGPQPAVDVRTARPFNIGSELVAPGLSMLGEEAGCRHLDRVHAYLNNLYRLGLIWFSRESISDPLRYQVLEAQPDVVAAMQKAGRARTVRRSIHLTPFGTDFCEVCLPLETAELDALPGDRARAPDTPSRREL